MLYWKLVRRRLGSSDAGAHTYLEIFITISNRGFFHLACRFQLGRHTRDTIIVTDNFMDDTRGIIITFIVTRQVNFITPLPLTTQPPFTEAHFFPFFFLLFVNDLFFLACGASPGAWTGFERVPCLLRFLVFVLLTEGDKGRRLLMDDRASPIGVNRDRIPVQGLIFHLHRDSIRKTFRCFRYDRFLPPFLLLFQNTKRDYVFIEKIIYQNW